MKKLKVGDKAPDFNLPGSDGKIYSLNDFRGKKLILYFYPKDMTPGCTTQACNLNENLSRLTKEGYTVVGISPDSVKSHKKFIEKHHLGFLLLSDENKEAANAYGVWGPKKFMGRTYEGIHRTTFIINEDGIISDIIDKPKVKEHAEEILQKKF
ncbi:MAG: peroxiredoxin [Vicingaceae bacterium]|nr:MAG: peroxiredoxin [Vicingaceae bacterium]